MISKLESRLCQNFTSVSKIVPRDIMRHKKGLYPESFQPFSRILGVINDSHTYIQNEFRVRYARKHLASSLRLQLAKLVLKQNLIASLDEISITSSI